LGRGRETGPGAGWVCLGAVTGVFGVRGEVRIKPFTEDALGVAAYGPVTFYPGAREVEITALRAAKGGVIARLKGVADRTAAEGLKGHRLYVPRTALPALEEEDSFYHDDLIGLRVEDTDGNAVGRIAAVQDFGAGDLLEIRPADGGKAFLLAFTRDLVPRVDLDGGRVVVHPIQDQLDEAPQEKSADHDESDARKEEG
jgi:16S rRNA processing protein RimM